MASSEKRSVLWPIPWLIGSGLVALSLHYLLSDRAGIIIARRFSKNLMEELKGEVTDDFLDLLLIYPAQAGQYQQLTMHAPSSLAWIPDGGRYFPHFHSAALFLAVAMAGAYCWSICRSRVKISAGLIVELALVSAIIVPFYLPKMHERYFYLADVLSLVLAFYLPSYFFVPLMMISISFFAYQPALFGVEPVPMGLLALGVFVLLVALLRHVFARLYPTHADG